MSDRPTQFFADPLWQLGFQARGQTRVYDASEADAKFAELEATVRSLQTELAGADEAAKVVHRELVLVRTTARDFQERAETAEQQLSEAQQMGNCPHCWAWVNFCSRARD